MNTETEKLKYKINQIIDGPIDYISDQKLKSILESEYQLQAIEFLVDAKTTLNINHTGQAIPKWGKQLVNKYSCTLKNTRGSLSFEFYDSIHNTEKRKSLRLDFYSVLACLNTYTPENFDDFCAEFGYEFKNETQYIEAKRTHLECIRQQKALERMFTSEELERLNDIN